MRILLLLLLVFQLVSCSKNENEQPLLPPAENTHLLKSFFVLDTTLIAPNDTLSKSIFEYDNLERVTTASSYSYNPATQNYSFRYSFIYSYPGTDTLANKIFENYNSGGAIIRWTHFITYNSDRQLLKDSSQDVVQAGGNYDSSVYTKHYVYQNNQYQEIRYTYYPDRDTTNGVFMGVEKDVYGNITSIGSGSIKGKLEYDGRRNPLYRTSPMNFPYYNTPDFPSYLENQSLPQKHNNLKKFTNTYDGAGNLITSTLTMEYKIIYNQEGLPSSIRRRSYPASFSDKYKYIFIYE